MRTRTFVLALVLLGLASVARSAPLPRLRPVATPGNAAAPMAAALDRRQVRADRLVVLE